MTVERYQKILDIGKGIGVIAMVLVHSLSWIIPREELHSHLREFPYTIFSYSLVITLFALFIPALAAAQLKLKKNNTSQIFDLAVLCLSAGFSFNFLLYSPEHWNHWDVLHFLGVSFFLLIPWSLSKNAFLDWCGLITFALFGPLLIPLFGVEHSLIKDVFVGENYTFWPLFPWFAMLLNGRLAVYYLNEKAIKQKTVLLFSIGFIIAGLAVPSSGEYLRLVWNRTASVYHPPAGVFVSLLSVFWLMLVLTDILMDKASVLAKTLSLLGRQIFWVFISHVLIGFTLAKKVVHFPVIPRTIGFILFMYGLCFLVAYTLELISSKRLLVRFAKQ